MKSIRFMSALLSLMIITGISSGIVAQEMKEVKIFTSMKCNDCKMKIEKELNGMAGISSTAADLSTNTVSVKYDASKMDQEKIMASIKKMGYTAELKNTQSEKSGCASKCGDKKQSGCCGKKQ